MSLFKKKDKKAGRDDAGSVRTFSDGSGGKVVVKLAPGAEERLGGLNLNALLRDVAGIGAESETEADKVWARFDAMTPTEQRAALNHSFSIQNRYSGAGWEHPEVALDGETYRYRISYIGPGLGRFIECVNGLKDGAEDNLTWMDEPGAYNWYFARRGDLVYVEIPNADEGVYLRYGDLCQQAEGLNGQYGF